ncbi:MAG: 2-C-methyl-D-erythritol 4-phosphate cytidylyltransferase [Gammaproteobacteria bacterium]|nr:2-C-methyl-D-erythritol 4-phosphate cytidylyltransferase [Gammaproteobacteria bacterium]
MSAAGAPDRYWALVPAAGTGQRMGADRPKQYLPLAGTTVLGFTLGRLLAHPPLEAVQVCLASGDSWWGQKEPAADPRLLAPAPGGAQRYETVLNGLHALGAAGAAARDWVLVHDAVRPCVTGTDLDRLLAALPGSDGALLAAPVADTLKRADPVGRVSETVDRKGLWRALTPQAFRLAELVAALEAVREAGAVVTDEAQAMERAGLAPALVEGRGDNIKITLPADLAMAEEIIRQQELQA